MDDRERAFYTRDRQERLDREYLTDAKGNTLVVLVCIALMLIFFCLSRWGESLQQSVNIMQAEDYGRWEVVSIYHNQWYPIDRLEILEREENGTLLIRVSGCSSGSFEQNSVFQTTNNVTVAYYGEIETKNGPNRLIVVLPKTHKWAKLYDPAPVHQVANLKRRITAFTFYWLFSQITGWFAAGCAGMVIILFGLMGINSRSRDCIYR